MNNHLIVLFATLVVATSSPPTADARTARARSQEPNLDRAYSEFLTAQSKREKAIQERVVEFVEALSHHREEGSSLPETSRVTYGTFRQSGIYEDYTRYKMIDYPGTADSVKFERVAADFPRVVQPEFARSDGARTLILTPTQGKENQWGGLLTSAVDHSTRSGCLNCGIMFNETWITDYCARSTLVRTELIDSDISFVFQEAPGAPGTTTFLVDSSTLLPKNIVWEKSGRLLSETSVLETARLSDGTEVVARSSVLYHYVPPLGATLIVALRFRDKEPSELAGEMRLLTIPPEISQTDGRARVIDEVTREKIALFGNEAKDAPPLETVSRGERQPEPSEEPSEEPWGRAIPLALGCLGLVAAALALTWRRVSRR